MGRIGDREFKEEFIEDAHEILNQNREIMLGFFHTIEFILMKRI